MLFGLCTKSISTNPRLPRNSNKNLLGRQHCAKDKVIHLGIRKLGQQDCNKIKKSTYAYKW